MVKKLIRLTEGDLHRIVKESVKKILKEYGENPNGSAQDFFGRIAGQAIINGNTEKLERINKAARSKGGGAANSPAFRNGMLNTMAIKDNGDKFASEVSRRIHNLRRKKGG